MKASAPATKPADPGQNRKKRLYAAFFLFFGAPPRTPPGALPLDPVGGSAPKPWPAFEKSGGKPGGKLLLISNGLCRPAAHRERRAWFAGREPGRAGGGLFASPAEIPAARGGGGVQGPGPLALAPEQARCRAQPGSGRVGVAHPPPPPRPLEFPPTPKRQRKSQAPRSMGPGCLNDPRKGQGNGPAPLGKAAAHALRAAAA